MENVYREYLNELQEKMDKLYDKIGRLSEALREDEDEFGVSYIVEGIREDISLLQAEYEEYEEAGRQEEY
jgi:hypothetical protein